MATGSEFSGLSSPSAELESEMPSGSRVVVYEEIVKNKGRSKCWLLISDKVYDVTGFLEEHPGGDEVLLASAGKDATDDFIDVGHSNDAKNMMDKYYIGEIDILTVPERKRRSNLPPPPISAKPDDSGFLLKILQLLLPLLILGAAFAFQFYGKKEAKQE